MPSPPLLPRLKVEAPVELLKSKVKPLFRVIAIVVVFGCAIKRATLFLAFFGGSRLLCALAPLLVGSASSFVSPKRKRRIKKAMWDMKTTLENGQQWNFLTASRNFLCEQVAVIAPSCFFFSFRTPLLSIYPFPTSSSPTPQEQGEQTTSLTWPTALGDYFATHSATQHPRKPHFVLCFISVTKYKL